MPEKLKTNLTVNNNPIELNEFAQEYVTRVVICAVSMLKGGKDVKKLTFILENNQPNLTINEKPIPLSPFPRDALRGTFTGMVSSLRGVHQINSLRININND